MDFGLIAYLLGALFVVGMCGEDKNPSALMAAVLGLLWPLVLPVYLGAMFERALDKYVGRKAS